MANTAALTWDSLAELRMMFRAMPASMQPEVTALVQAHARSAHGALLAAYPQGRTGNLRRGVRLTASTVHGTAAAAVTSLAPHAGIYENGTKPREGRGGNAVGKGSRSGGALANRGMAPPHYTFGRTVYPQRQQLFEELTALLVRRGFEVHEDAA